MKIIDMEKQIAITAENPRRFVLAEGINLSTGEVVEKISYDTGDYWTSEWAVIRDATKQEKAEILAALPEFNRQRKLANIYNAAMLIANWGFTMTEALNKYGLPAKCADAVNSEIKKLADAGCFE